MVSLEAERARVAQEAARLVEAIAQGSGSSSLIVEQIKRHEARLVELDARIADAAALIQPLLVPSAASKFADYVLGSASIFRDDHARDRALVERVLDRILIYPAGEIVLVFHRDSLFAPVVSATMKGDAKGATRAEHQRMFTELRKRSASEARVSVYQFGDRAGYLATTSRKVAADDDDGYGLSGSGEIALATPTGQARDFARAGAEVGSTASEITLATPTGFERPEGADQTDAQVRDSARISGGEIGLDGLELRAAVLRSLRRASAEMSRGNAAGAQAQLAATMLLLEPAEQPEQPAIPERGRPRLRSVK